MDNLIQIHADALDISLCAQLISLFSIADPPRCDLGYRRCRLLEIPNAHPASHEAFYKFCRQVRGPLEIYGQYVKNHLDHCRQIERPNIICYEPKHDGEPPDHFHEHADAWDVDSATRQVAMIGYLNTVEEGGETVFPNYDLVIKPQEGDLLIFPAGFTHTHLSKPPISRSKYCVVTWLHFTGPVKFACYPFSL